ncbi:hypothetical protein [Enterovibrio norvegicus]|nr:hypothetical protein [Enterovibrio norvegicus]
MHTRIQRRAFFFAEITRVYSNKIKCHIQRSRPSASALPTTASLLTVNTP